MPTRSADSYRSAAFRPARAWLWSAVGTPTFDRHVHGGCARPPGSLQPLSLSVYDAGAGRHHDEDGGDGARPGRAPHAFGWNHLVHGFCRRSEIVFTLQQQSCQKSLRTARSCSIVSSALPIHRHGPEGTSRGAEVRRGVAGLPDSTVQRGVGGLSRSPARHGRSRTCSRGRRARASLTRPPAHAFWTRFTADGTCADARWGGAVWEGARTRRTYAPQAHGVCGLGARARSVHQVVNRSRRDPASQGIR